MGHRGCGSTGFWARLFGRRVSSDEAGLGPCRHCVGNSPLAFPSLRCSYDEQSRLLAVWTAASGSFLLDPAAVRRADTSVASINEWTGELSPPSSIPGDIAPQSLAPLGNYAVQITWEDGFNQVRVCLSVLCISVLTSVHPYACVLLSCSFVWPH
jgi:hypothetical protein